VTVTRGLIAALDRDEMEAVLAHELTHVINKDVRTMIIASIFAAQALAASPLTVKTTRLPNGLTVILAKYPSPGAVAYQIPVRVGSRNEVEPGKTGFAHFFEHLMFRGTKSMPGAEFERLHNRLGCEHNAWTSNDMTNYHGTVAKDRLSKILKAEADRFKNLWFDEKALKDEAGAVMGEYNKNASQPELPLEEAIAAETFSVHPYAHTTLGFKQDIEKYGSRFDDVWPFFRRHYRPEAARVVLVGDVDFNADLKMVKKYFGDWNPAPEPALPIAVEPPLKGPKERMVKLDRPTQPRVAVAFRVPAFTTARRDHAAFDILSEALFSTVSPFQKEYRYQKRWVDEVGVEHPDSIDPGLFTVILRIAPDGVTHMAELAEAVSHAVATAGEKTLEPALLDATRRRLLASVRSSWYGSPEAVASRLAWYTNFENDEHVLDRVMSGLEKVTAEEIRAVAALHLVPTNRAVIRLEGSGP
jgi:zinc protease